MKERQDLADETFMTCSWTVLQLIYQSWFQTDTAPPSGEQDLVTETPIDTDAAVGKFKMWIGTCRSIKHVTFLIRIWYKKIAVFMLSWVDHAEALTQTPVQGRAWGRMATRWATAFKVCFTQFDSTHWNKWHWSFGLLPKVELILAYCTILWTKEIQECREEDSSHEQSRMNHVFGLMHQPTDASWISCHIRGFICMQ